MRPSGEKAQYRIDAEWPLSTASSLPVFEFQIFTSRSMLPVARRRPSNETSSVVTSSEWAWTAATFLPPGNLTISSRPSLVPAAAQLQFLAATEQVNGALSRNNSLNDLPASASAIRSVRSSDDERICFPSGEMEQPLTRFRWLRRTVGSACPMVHR